MDKFLEEIKNKRILAAVGIVALVLGLTLPYFKFSFLGYTSSISLFGYFEGKIMFLIILANLLFIFKDYVEQYAPQMFNSQVGSIVKKLDDKFSLVPTILIAAFAIWLYLRLDVDTQFLKYGLGFWALWLGVICLVAHSFIYKKK